MALFYKDTPGKLDVVNPMEDSEANMGLKARYEFTKQCHCRYDGTDLFFQDRLILNGVNLRIKVNREQKFFLFGFINRSSRIQSR